MKKARTEKSVAPRSLSREELRLVTGGDGGLLAFPFIQQAMQGSTSPVEPA
jgi:hypothetical protein